jgi:hypothetical protein
LSHGLEGFPTVNLQPNAASSSHSTLSDLVAPADDHTQYLLASAATSRAAFAANWTDLTDGGTTTLHSHAGGSGQSDPGFYGVYFRESDGNPPTFRNDTLIFDSTFFYLSSDSVGKPTVSVRMTPGGGGTGGGVSAHSALTGLSADDHTQYSLVDGTRAYTGVVSGITPTAAANLATKGYVDTTVGPGFYGIFVRESDGNPPTYKNDTLIFDSAYFYLNSNSVGKPMVSFRDAAPSGSTALAKSFGILGEWVFSHNLNTDNLVWSVYDNRQIAIIPEKVDTSDPNTAYFYFIPPIAGKAVLVGGLNTAGSVTAASGITTVTDGTSTYNNQVRLNFSNRDFYISHGGIPGSPVINLTARAIEYIPGFIETASVMNLTIDPFAPYGYRFNNVKIDCRSGSCVGGFYLLPRVSRSSATVWKGHAVGVEIPFVGKVPGTDRINISTTPQTLIPSSTISVNTGDCLIFSIGENTQAKWIRISIEAERL